MSQSLFDTVVPRLEALARSNAVIGPVTTVGERHVIPLVEISLGLGGGGAGGEGEDPESSAHGKGHGGGAGGGTRVTPVAVVVVENGAARIESLGH